LNITIPIFGKIGIKKLNNKNEEHSPNNIVIYWGVLISRLVGHFHSVDRLVRWIQVRLLAESNVWIGTLNDASSAWIKVSANDFYGARLLVYGEDNHAEEKQMVAFISKTLRSGNANYLMDVGASYGAVTLAVAHLGKKIFAYEPQENIFNYLECSVNKNNFKNILTKKLALGNKKTRRGLIGSEDSSAMGHFDDIAFSEMVNASSIDDEMVEEELQERGLLKIDVEGYEHEVISGAERFLKLKQPIVIFEISKYWLINSNLHLDKTENILRKNGYSKMGYFRIDRHLEIANIIAIPQWFESDMEKETVTPLNSLQEIADLMIRRGN